MLDLTAWREILHADFLFSQGRGGRKEFLRNAGLSGLDGLARDTSRRFFVLAKAQRTQRNSYGMQDLADLVAWREIVYADSLFSQGRGGRKEFLRNAGLDGLARVFNDSRTRIYFLAKAQRTQRY